MQTIVLAGGACAGKSTVLDVLPKEFPKEIIVVPELATRFIETRFNLLGRHPATRLAEWQTALQTSIALHQPLIEDEYKLIAEETGAQIIIFDRGLLCGGAYTPGGLKEFCRKYNIDLAQALARYSCVLHLESCATGAPEFYGVHNNNARRETLEEAVDLEKRTRLVWADHPNLIFLPCELGIKGKINRACEIVDNMIKKTATTPNHISRPS